MSFDPTRKALGNYQNFFFSEEFRVICSRSEWVTFSVANVAKHRRSIDNKYNARGPRPDRLYVESLCASGNSTLIV